MLQFTEEQVLQLAPDTASAKAGSQLAVNSKWVKKSVSDLALWGLCQGSGKDPYLTMVDTTNLAFKCSCPSRKFPCKHGLGLLLLFARDKNGFVTEPMSEKVAEWINKRQEKETKKEEKNSDSEPKSEKELEASKQAATKRVEARERKVKDGVEELRSWIKDMVRTGLMGLPANAGQFHLNMAARLVDAQASGLAGMVRNLGELNLFQDGWQLEITQQLSRIYLFTECFKNETQLDPEFAREIRTVIGWNIGKEEVLATPVVSDRWLILSRRMEQVQEMTSEQIWMYGLHQHRFAVVLNFYFGAQLPQHLLAPGMVQEAEVCYYPSVQPLRVLIKEQKATFAFSEPPCKQDFERVLHEVSERMSQMPLLFRIPFAVEKLMLLRSGNSWILIDKNSKSILLRNESSECWKLLAWSGGKSFDAFLVYELGTWRVESAWMGENFISLT